MEFLVPKCGKRCIVIFEKVQYNYLTATFRCFQETLFNSTFYSHHQFTNHDAQNFTTQLDAHFAGRRVYRHGTTKRSAAT